MVKTKKKLRELRKEEESITALFANKLHAIFRSTYRNAKTVSAKSKNRSGDKKSSTAAKVRKISQKNLDGIKKELRLLIAFYGIGTPHRELVEQPKLSQEQIAIMDIDFDGLYFTPASETLSPKYTALKSLFSAEPEHYRYSPSDYELNNVPIWSEMKKFNSFRSMYRPICHQLAKLEYPPQELHLLNISDMVDLIACHNRENPNRRMQSQRTRFLKMFAACYGEKFIEKMALMGKEQIALDFMTYIDYIDKPKQKCPPEVRYAGELFNVHHVKNRKYAEELHDYSQVNDFSNLALCFVFPHHKILHTPCEIDLNPNIIFFGSFLSEFQITRNPGKERMYLRGISTTKSQDCQK